MTDFPPPWAQEIFDEMKHCVACGELVDFTGPYEASLAAMAMGSFWHVGCREPALAYVKDLLERWDRAERAYSE